MLTCIYWTDHPCKCPETLADTGNFPLAGTPHSIIERFTRQQHKVGLSGKCLSHNLKAIRPVADK